MKNGSDKGPKVFTVTSLGFKLKMNCSNTHCKEPLAEGSFAISIPLEKDFSTLKLERVNCPECGVENLRGVLFLSKKEAEKFCNKPSSQQILFGKTDQPFQQKASH